MRTATVSEVLADLPNIDPSRFKQPSAAELFPPGRATHAPRFLLLYGSLRERSYSRLVAEEAARLRRALGGETRLFNPSGLPLVDDASEDHPKVRELHELVRWAEGMIWSSPERHGAMSGLMKTQIDWIPLSMGAMRPTQGKTLAVMQVSGIPVIQRREPDAGAGPLDAHADHPEPIVGGQGLPGVRRGGTHAAFALL